MLTKLDLSEIQKIVQGETRKIVREETREIMQKELQPVKKDIVEIRKDMKTIVNFFDSGYLELRKRVEQIEERLGIIPN